MASSIRFAASLLGLMLLAGCAGMPAPTPEAEQKPAYKPLNYSDLPNWPPASAGQADKALQAVQTSCARLVKLPAERSLGADGRMGTVGQWQPFCRMALQTKSGQALVSLVQQQLTPWRVETTSGTSQGLFTGYYVATLRGSRTRHGAYQTPLYARPPELVMVNLGDFRPELAGQRIAGSVQNGTLKPYADRSRIVAGGLNSRGLEIVWLDNPIDAFLVQVQGSGTVELDDGSKTHLSYDGQNGHPYRAIGAELIKRGAMTKDEVSMPAIKAWLKDNPSQVDSLLNSNPSYVFFKEDRTALAKGAVGAANVPLTPEASLAVDNRYIGYHVPLWLVAENPAGRDAAPLNNLMVAQDTGGAIRGVVRGDFFWGQGDKAEQMAGLMKSRGQLYALLPRGLNPNTPPSSP